MALDSHRLQKPISKLRKILKKDLKRATPEQVHDLRTNTRRFEAALSALELADQARQRRLLKLLAKVRKRAGRVRDMDVLTNYAAHVRSEGERDCSVQLLEDLGSRRADHAKRLNSAVRKSGKQARKLLKATSDQLEKVASSKTKNGRGTEKQVSASTRATAAALALESELANVPRLTSNNLHGYRLKVKELQNVLRIAAHGEDRQFVDALGQVKDDIGAWHDWQELTEIAKEVLDHGSGCKLIRELEQNTENKYKIALTRANKLRSNYFRQSGKRTPPVWGEMWEATAAIAA